MEGPVIPSCIMPLLVSLHLVIRAVSLVRFLLAALALVMTPDFPMAGQLSPLAPRPTGPALDAYQRTITRQEFSRLIDQVYSPDGGFWNYADIDDDKRGGFSDTAKTHPSSPSTFAASDSRLRAAALSYKTQATLPPIRPDRSRAFASPSIPGHIGGDWAQLEARYFKLGDDPPVEEATLNMITCERLAERLQADGADVVWAKHDYEPVTPLRPDDLHREAIAALALGNPTRPVTAQKRSAAFIKRMIDNEAALLFYRVAEIRARATWSTSSIPT
jgi:hypothetical protein